jgi:hypothetical protein
MSCVGCSALPFIPCPIHSAYHRSPLLVGFTVLPDKIFRTGHRESVPVEGVVEG